MARITRDLRSENRVHIYEQLQNAQITSRTELSKMTGISAPTVLRIVDELMELGIVRETQLDNHSVGRPCVGLAFQSDYACTASILHEGSWVTASLMDMSGKVYASKQESANADFEQLVRKQIPALIDDLLLQCKMPVKKLAGIGMGFPAVLDPYENVIEYAPLIHINEPLDISAWVSELEARYDAFVCIENDVNALVMGEHAARKLEDRMDMAYVALGTGIGAGLMLRGKLRRGKNNRAGEIGMSLCHDGRSLEEHIGNRALEERFGGENDPQGAMTEYIVDTLSHHLVNYALGFDLDLIVLGGHTVNRLGKSLVAAVREKVNALSPLPIRIEEGVSEEPGLEGLGQLLRSRLIQQLHKIGLDAIKKYL